MNIKSSRIDSCCDNNEHGTRGSPKSIVQKLESSSEEARLWATYV